MVTEMCCLFSLDVETVHSPLVPKIVLQIRIFLISPGFKKALYIQAYHGIYCSSKEQRLDSILALVITRAAHVSKDAVNPFFRQALSLACGAAKMSFGLVCIKSELLAEEFSLQGCTLAEEISLSFKNWLYFFLLPPNHMSLEQGLRIWVD